MTLSRREAFKATLLGGASLTVLAEPEKALAVTALRQQDIIPI